MPAPSATDRMRRTIERERAATRRRRVWAALGRMHTSPWKRASDEAVLSPAKDGDGYTVQCLRQGCDHARAECPASLLAHQHQVVAILAGHCPFHLREETRRDDRGLLCRRCGTYFRLVDHEGGWLVEVDYPGPGGWGLPW